MGLFLRQTWTLTRKNILVVLFRHPFTTPVRCFVLPLVLTIFLAYARNLFVPPSQYGIGDTTPIRSFVNALSAAQSRDTVAFVNNGFTGGDINMLITNIGDQARSAGKNVEVLEQEEELLKVCRNSIRGVSKCYGAAVFYASPTEGPGGQWNYSLRADGNLGIKIDTNNVNNDQEIYALPFQHTIDFAIAQQNATIDQGSIPDRVDEYPYTSQTQKQHSDSIRISYMGGITNILAVAFFIAMVGVIYQLVGLMASERELGMTQIIEASMPNQRRWEPQAARLLAVHLAFDIMFLPGWIAVGVITSLGVFAKSNAGLVIIFNILAGLSLSSFSIFGAAFFRKAQLSGISTTIISLLLAVVAQIVGKSSTGAVAILSLLFPPMNYTFFTILMARWERQNTGTNLVKSAPKNPSTLPGIALWIFAIVHIFVFPILGAFIERKLYGTTSKGRQLSTANESSGAAVKLSGYTKRYEPSWWAKKIAGRFSEPKETVVAVDQLDLTIPQGQIMVLLGANGSGKSTTLEAIAGLNTVTSGTVAVDGFGGLGICPQRNVLWDTLTTFEHVKIFNRLKSTGKVSSTEEIHKLIEECDLDRKVSAQSRHLSGGQKRKLQLSMMFTGGSRVCCVDECSSGVDALARQKLWSILLNERGKRTFIFTTHFLDEADLLSDQIAILSRGVLKAQGSAVELKHRLGGGYRIHVYKSPGEERVLPNFGIPSKEMFDQTVFTLPDSGQAADFVRRIEAHGIQNYEISSPSIEEIFFNIAENLEASMPTRLLEIDKPSHNDSEDKPIEEVSITDKGVSRGEDDLGLSLQNGRKIGAVRQAFTLFHKRWTVLQRNYLPYFAAFLIPVIAAGLVTLFLSDAHRPNCNPADTADSFKIQSLLTQENYDLVIGPASKFSPQDLARLEATLPGGNSTGSGGSGLSSLQSSVHTIDGTIDDFNNYIKQFRANVTPGGIFLGDDRSPPTVAYKGNGGLQLATITQNWLDNLLLNVSISSQYQPFDIPFSPSASKTLELIVYFGLAMCAYPAFFALYPTLERLRNVRQLHYSNGVRSISLWSAYLTFDFVVVVIVSVLAIIIFRASSDAFYHAEYLFVVFFCYGLASTLYSYVISLAAQSQLAAFAFAAGGQAVSFLIYFFAYISVLTYVSADKIDNTILIVHFTIALVTPAGNLIRALFVALNVFSTLCSDQDQIASYPGKITLYGGPILYLIGQSVFLFGVLLWWDSGSVLARLRRKQHKDQDAEESTPIDEDIATEIKRVGASTTDGLRVQHVTKAFGTNVAVQDITFGVKRGEVFALLGPNGAGKSTTISLIRGDLLPSHNSGEILVEDIPLSKRRAAARLHLGVCPQVDACDQMTVLEHLRFYARVRGVEDVEHNVHEVIRAVGLGPFQHRMAFKLSGGNKRKLCLAIALMGNPSVLLLDEPSSGMDVCAKRVMWKTLASVVPGRSLVLTTHSMEEADALADRSGIMGKKMLALGTSENLRKKHGDRYHVHLIMKTAPHTSDSDMTRVKNWISTNLPGASIEDKTFHGQLRFSVPAHRTTSQRSQIPSTLSDASDSISALTNTKDTKDTKDTNRSSGIGALFTRLESHKEELGFEYFSVSQTTLDQVFLSIVGKHNIEEENYGQGGRGRGWRGLVRGRRRG